VIILQLSTAARVSAETVHEHSVDIATLTPKFNILHVSDKETVDKTVNHHLLLTLTLTLVLTLTLRHMTLTVFTLFENSLDCSFTAKVVSRQYDKVYMTEI